MKYILGVLLLMGFNACTKNDLLDLKPDGAISPATFYKTDEQVQQALFAVYDPLQWNVWTGETFMWGSIASDDATAGGADESDQLDFQLVDRFQLTAYTSKGQNNLLIYEQWFQLIARANYLICNIQISDNFAKSAIDQAYFLKAFAYFQLTRMYGGLPIIDKIPIATDKFPRASQADTWTAIEGYLKKALNDNLIPVRLGGQDPSDGQATLAAAQTLLGKVYLYEKKYSDAISILEQVAQNNQYSLEDNYSDIFSPANKHGKESIFEINFSEVNQGAGWDNLANSNSTFTLCGPRTGEVSIPDPATFQWGWGMNQPTSKLATAFDALGDIVRKNNSIISSDSVRWYYTNDSSTVTFQNEETGWWDLKHVRRKGYFATTNQVGQNTIVFRLSDVFLMLAEAYNQSGNDAKALENFNKVRTRAKLASASGSGADLFEQIKKERRLELCLEGDRYFDLVRWGDAATVLTAETYEPSSSSYADGAPGTKTNGLFPIPQQEMDAYGADTTSFQQNPGY